MAVKDISLQANYNTKIIFTRWKHKSNIYSHDNFQNAYYTQVELLMSIYCFFIGHSMENSFVHLT